MQLLPIHFNNLARIADLFAIPMFMFTLVYFFYNVPNKGRQEYLIMAFCCVGLIIDTICSLDFMKVFNTLELFDTNEVNDNERLAKHDMKHEYTSSESYAPSIPESDSGVSADPAMEVDSEPESIVSVESEPESGAGVESVESDSDVPSE